MSNAFLFPGQGAQYPGMAKDLYESSDTVKELFKAAKDACGRDFAEIMFEGDEETLKITENTQAAVTLHNISAAAFLRERGIEAAAVAGFSVGEYAALYSAGVLSIQDLFTAVRIRGELMEEGSRAHDGEEGPSAMTAVLGLAYEAAAEVVEPMADKGVFIANHSSPTQVVIAGTAAGLSAAEEALSQAGAMKVVRLKVSGPFHSPLLRDAADQFAKEIASLTFNDPVLPFYSNVSGVREQSGDQLKAFAAQQIYSTVRWVSIMGQVAETKPERVLEVGPGKVLGGLWRSFDRGTKVKPCGTVEGIEALFS